MSEKIAVHELRVGMFIHLDVSWMSHPFPRSSFRIDAESQIEALRAVGLGEVRWEPARSDVAGGGAEVAAAPPQAAAPSERPTARRPRGPSAPLPPALRAQRLAALRCERAYTAAGETVATALRDVTARPEQARAAAEALAASLRDSVRADHPLTIRLLDGHDLDPLAAHAVNVGVISLLLGRFCGLDDQDLLDLGVGALLHDIGHLELPERVRDPHDDFTAADLQAYRTHVALGVAQGRRMGLSEGALLVLAQHHEHADGSGFPLRLPSERLSMPARIVALVDRFDRLCNPAPPARGLSPHEALSMLFAQCRTQYDTPLLNSFIRMVGVYPAGSVVQLTDDRYALVVGVNSMRPLKPRVLVHDPQVPREAAMLLNLESLPDLGIRRSLPPQHLPAEALRYLAPPQRVACYFEPPPAAEPARRAAPEAQFG